MSAEAWAIAALCAFLVGFAKTGVSGAGTIVVPLFASIFPARRSVGVLLPILLIGDLLALAWYRREADWRHLARLAPWTLVGLGGAFALYAGAGLDERATRRLIGGIVLSVLALGEWRRRRPRAALPAWMAPLCGLGGGFASGAANAAGPVLIVYLLAAGLPKTALIGTGAWFYFVVNLAKLPLQIGLGHLDLDALGLALALAPAVGLGAATGIWTVRRLPQGVFDLAVRVLAGLAALRLLLG